MDFKISLPFAVISNAWNFLTKFLFYRTYLASHLSWTRRHVLGAHWQNCSGLFEYTLYLAQITDDETDRVPKIAFRAKNHGIKSLTVVFEAQSALHRFQQKIELTQVSPTPIVYALTNIPCDDILHIDPHRGILLFALESFDLRVLSVEMLDGSTVRPFKTATHHLSHTWLLNSRWVRRWGFIWNVDAINSAKQHISEFWQFSIDPNSRFVFRKYGHRSSLRETLVRPLRQLVCFSLSNSWTVSAQFWLAIFSGRFEFGKDGRLRKRESVRSVIFLSGET